MRNLKKFLALVLAMVMAFSLMLTASAVDYDDYQDKDSIPTEFAESVEVLTGLDILKGDGPDGAKSFRPGDTITRAEAAAIIYRVATADVNDAQVNIYADYSNFTDVKKDDWFAGYVGYCQNAGYIKGTTPTTFNPYGQVTGYEALAMILRVVGYGKNNEFVGPEWQVNVASRAKTLGVTKNVVNANFETTLNYAARRDVVADLVFQTMATVPMVEFTPALAYNDKMSVVSDTFNPTLGQQNFGLFCGEEWTTIDDWGRPGYYWYKNGTWNGRKVTGAGYLAYAVSANHPIYEAYNWSAADWAANTVATIEAAPSYETKEQVHECDVAAALKFDGQRIFELYVNSPVAVTETYRVVATDTVTKVGGQGRVTEFYYNSSSKWFPATTSRAVMIDTLLARVNSKTNAVLDPAEHVITPAKLDVTIYDGQDKTNVASVSANAISNRTISKPSSSKANWDEYSVGDYILIHAYTNKVQNAAGGIAPAVAVSALGNNIVRSTQDQKEAAAFETNKVVTGTLTQGSNVWIAQNDNNGKAPSIQGKQTVTYWNQGKHQVDGKDYPDQMTLFLDRCGSTTNTTFTWFFDLYGNLIGIGDAKTTNYGVITSVYAAFVQGDSQTDGKVKAMATVKFTDGSTGTVEIDRFLMSYKDNTVITGTGTTAGTDYGATPNTALQMNGSVEVAGVATPVTADNTICLWPVYDNGSHPAMSAGPVGTTGYAAADAEFTGWLYMAPSAVTNTNGHFGTTVGGTNYATDAFGILYDHMFEFTTASDDTVVAIEVAGHTLNTTGANLTTSAGENATNMNNGVYVNKFNASAVNNEGKLYKSLGYVTLNNMTSTTPAASAANVWLSSSTQIIVRNGRTLSTYTLETLPGNVDLTGTSEVDWADVDGDGRADYLYITGDIPGVLTYGLFYYNGGAAQWDAATNTGTIVGYLNGEAKTLTFASRAQFNAVQGSNGYDGHLFALQLENDVVSAVMEADNEASANWGIYLLGDYTTANSPINTSGTVLKFDANGLSATAGEVDNIRTAAAGDNFGIGAGHGNTYTATTEAVYYDTSVTGTTYSRVNLGNVINAGGTEYYLAPTAKIIGELEWLNTRDCDLTIVYENGAAKSAVQVYIITDPDITPVNPGSTLASYPTGAAVVNLGATTEANLQTAIYNGSPNTVVYGGFTGTPTLNPFTGYPIDNTTDPVADNLFFPFAASVGDTPTLEIWNTATGASVYSETATARVDGSLGFPSGKWAFAVNFTGNTNNAGWPKIVALTTGTEYSFRITITNASGIVTLSSGSFVMQ